VVPGEPGEHLAADVVDGALPLDALQRLAAEIDLAAQQDAGGTELLQSNPARWLAGDGDHLVAPARQHVHGDAAHAAAGAGDNHRLALRVEAVVAQALDGERGR